VPFTSSESARTVGEPPFDGSEDLGWLVEVLGGTICGKVHRLAGGPATVENTQARPAACAAWKGSARDGLTAAARDA
jgi:hypothetical protein